MNIQKHLREIDIKVVELEAALASLRAPAPEAPAVQRAAAEEKHAKVEQNTAEKITEASLTHAAMPLTQQRAPRATQELAISAGATYAERALVKQIRALKAKRAALRRKFKNLNTAAENLGEITVKMRAEVLAEEAYLAKLRAQMRNAVVKQSLANASAKDTSVEVITAALAASASPSDGGYAAGILGRVINAKPVPTPARVLADEIKFYLHLIRSQEYRLERKEQALYNWLAKEQRAKESLRAGARGRPRVGRSRGSRGSTELTKDISTTNGNTNLPVTTKSNTTKENFNE